MIGPGIFKFETNRDAKRNHQRQEDDRFRKILKRFVGPVDKHIQEIREEMRQLRQDRIKEIKGQIGKAIYNEYGEIIRQLKGDQTEGTAKLREEYAEEQNSLKGELAELEGDDHG